MFLLTTINTLPYYQRNYRYVLIKRIDKGFKLQFSQKVPKSCIAPTSYLKSELYTYEHIFIIYNSIESLVILPKLALKIFQILPLISQVIPFTFTNSTHSTPYRDICVQYVIAFASRGLSISNCSYLHYRMEGEGAQVGEKGEGGEGGIHTADSQSLSHTPGHMRRWAMSKRMLTDQPHLQLPPPAPTAPLALLRLPFAVKNVWRQLYFYVHITHTHTYTHRHTLAHTHKHVRNSFHSLAHFYVRNFYFNSFKICV